MRTKMISIPFDLELAKKITNGEIEGRIVTREGRNVRVICWDKKDKDYPIVCLVNDDFEENIKTYTTQGEWNTCKSCAIIKNDLSLEVPEYMTFKDGDIVAFGENNDHVGIFKSLNLKEKTFSSYATLTSKSLVFYEPAWMLINIHIATKEQRQRIINALKSSEVPKAKECLKKLGIEEKPEYEFTPFEKVLVRNYLAEGWTADIFSYKDVDGSYICVGGLRSYCIPYNNETAHLLGTTEKYEQRRY